MKTYIGPLLISINVLFAVSLYLSFVLTFDGPLVYYPFIKLSPCVIIVIEIVLIRKAIKAGAKFSNLTLWLAYIVLPVIAGLSLIIMYIIIWDML